MGGETAWALALSSSHREPEAGWADWSHAERDRPWRQPLPGAMGKINPVPGIGDLKSNGPSSPLWTGTCLVRVSLSFVSPFSCTYIAERCQSGANLLAGGSLSSGVT